MDINYTDISIVLDVSGSMHKIKSDTIGGFNSFLNDQKKLKGKCTLTLAKFNHGYIMPYFGIDINKVSELTDYTFLPNGNTALYDAIGRTIESTGHRLSMMPSTERPSNVIFVILTDGEENCSVNYSYSKIKEMIEHQQTKYSWSFVFLGANQDAIATAGGLGIKAGNALTYTHDSEGACFAFNTVSSNIASYRNGSKDYSSDFF